MELVTSQSVYYSNKAHLQIEDVAASLLSLKAFIEVTPEILERLYPGLHVQRVDVHINELKAGSLFEDFVIKFVFGDQAAFDKAIESVKKKLRVDEYLANKPLLSQILVGLILTAGEVGLQRLGAPDEQKQVIQINKSVVIVDGAARAGVKESELNSAIEDAVKRNNHLVKEAVKVVQPAKREVDTSIVFNRDVGSVIQSQTVRAMPSMSVEDTREETMEDYEDVEIQIRATDLDSTKKGWGAVLPSIGNRRAKMHLDPHINPNDLLGKAYVQGDVTVLYKYDDNGKAYPSLIYLRNIRK